MGCPAAVQSACVRLPPLNVSEHALVSEKRRLGLYSTPKAGATVVAQMGLRYFGRYASALNYSTWIHDYHYEVFNEEPGHAPPPPCDACRRRGWTCVVVVRNPADRAVSSFLHLAARRGLLNRAMPWLSNDPSFADFIAGITEHPNGAPAGYGVLNRHASAQSVRCLEGLEGDPSVFHLPLETIAAGGLDALRDETDVYLDAAGLTSSHYHDYEAAGAEAPPDASRTPFSALGSPFPPVEAFLARADLSANLLACAYAADVALYRRACAQPWLRQACAPCALTCDAQVARLDRFLGARRRRVTASN